MGKKSKRAKQKKAPPPAAATAAAAPASAATAANSRGKRNSKPSPSKPSKGGKGKGGTANSADDIFSLLSRHGLHNPFTATTRAELDAIRTPPVASSDEFDPAKAPEDASCWICLEGPVDGNPEPLRRDCACRGSDGYVHLPCISAYAASRSEEIWCGKRKAAPNADWLAFAQPWESCPNCKQYFSGRLRLDVAREHARTTEGMVGGDRAVRHVVARSWVTKSLADIREHGMFCQAENYEGLWKEYDELLDLIEASLPIYEGDAKGPAMMYIHATLHQLEGETKSNYSQMVAMRLQKTNSLDPVVSREQRQLYQKWNKLMNSAMEIFDGLRGHPMMNSEQMELCSLQIQTQYSHISKEFSYFARSESEKNTPARNETEVLRLSEELMCAHMEQRGETSTDGIRFALVHAQKLMMAREDWRPFEALALLERTLRTSLLSLGPSHDLTDQLRDNLGNLLSSNRKAAYRYDPCRTHCPVLRYEEDCNVYFVDITNLENKLPGVNDGEEMGWDPADVVLKRGALVECVDLVRAQHLNGKRAWVEDYDEGTERHRVQFEDKSAKPCLVKPANLRLLFLGEEYEPIASEDGDEESATKGEGGSGDVASLVKEDWKEEEEVDSDIPDLV